jgi:hypothetical protein
MKLNMVKAVDSINQSTDKDWLKGFRTRMMAAGVKEIVDGVDRRLVELHDLALERAIGKPPADMTLNERVWEAIRVYEAFLAHKHGGKRVPASRTKDMIKRHGEKEAVRRTVKNLNMSNGLELLEQHGRLDCAYEQIVLDFPLEFDESLKVKARANLARATG